MAALGVPGLPDASFQSLPSSSQVSPLCLNVFPCLLQGHLPLDLGPLLSKMIAYQDA